MWGDCLLIEIRGECMIWLCIARGRGNRRKAYGRLKGHRESLLEWQRTAAL